MAPPSPIQTWRQRLYTVIFEADTRAGRLFDEVLIAAILVSLLVVVLTVVMVMGTLMYVMEGPANGYTSIPVGVYWAITTVTTVGFGDITPKTDLGRALALVMMLMGWGVLAVPTGIVTAEMVGASRPNAPVTTRTCSHCLTEGLEPDDRFCRHCGQALPDNQSDPRP